MKRLIKNYFLVNLFVSLLFLFSNVQKIPLWLSSTRQQFDIFWKLLENLQGLWWKPFLKTFKLFKNGLRSAGFSISFPNTLLWLFQTLTRNAFLWMITLLGANTPESPKIWQKKKSFIKYLEILRRETFLLYLHTNYTSFLKYILLKKSMWNLKSFYVKISLKILLV